MLDEMTRTKNSAASDQWNRTAISFMDLRQAHFEYEPFPIGLVRNVFEPTLYERFVDSFPPVKIFRFMQLHGDKWSLSELNNSRQYHKFLHANTDWRYLYEQVKSPAFIAQVLDELARHKIALGLTAATRSNGPQRLLNKLLGRRSSGLKARFEFSMMSAAGGHILPHTDSPQKLITLVMSIVRPGEWNQTWGGGTDRMRPLDPSDNFNFLNRYLRFDQTETIGTIPYEPNQCAIFIKTFNSLHGVQPMRGPAAAMRRTLTVNIEAV